MQTFQIEQPKGYSEELNPSDKLSYHARPGLVKSFLSTEKRVKEIKEVVCEITGISVDDLHQRRRYRALVLPRHLCFKFIKENTDLTLKQIAQTFCGAVKDHTTVIHGLREVKGKLKIKDDIVTDYVNEIYKRI